MAAAFPYKIPTVWTDNGMAFVEQARYWGDITDRYMGGLIFKRVCREHGIEHRLTKPDHPWINGQVERMNHTVKEASITEFHYPDFEALRAHVMAFITAFNFTKHLKALRWRTPFQFTCAAWSKDSS